MRNRKHSKEKDGYCLLLSQNELTATFGIDGALSFAELIRAGFASVLTEEKPSFIAYCDHPNPVLLSKVNFSEVVLRSIHNRQ